MSQTLLLIESGKEQYRGFTLEALKKDDVNIVLVSKDEPTWQRKYISDYISANVDEHDKFFIKVVEYNRQQPLHGVLTFVERLVPLTAEISEILGCRFVTPEIALGARNKMKMRAKFAMAGLPTPKSISLDAAERDFPSDFQFPAVIKPVMGFASLNVFRIESWDDLEWAKSIIAKDNHPTLPHPGEAYLIEEYIDGKEFSVESVVSGDKICHYEITKKVTCPEPYFEEVAHITPAHLSAFEREAILNSVEKGIRALGLNNCATHSEIRLSSKRGPVLIEVAARLGGDKIPFLVELTTGASPSAAAGRAALDREIPSAREPNKYAGIVFFVPLKSGISNKTITVPPDNVKGIVEFRCDVVAGQKVIAPPDQFFTRLGFAIVEGCSYEQVARELELVVQYIEQHTGLALASKLSY